MGGPQWPPLLGYRDHRYFGNLKTSHVGMTAAIMLALMTMPACRRVDGPAQSAAPAGRIISLSPGVTEILYGIGAFGSLVADSEFCDFPAEATRLPHVGGFFDANLEAIAALKPDLLIVIEDQAAFLKDKVEQMGIAVLVVKCRTVPDIVESIRSIGRETGHQTEAESLADSVQASVERRAKQSSALSHPRVLCVIDRLPGTLKDIYVASANSFLGDLIAASGGQNIAPSDKQGYARMQGEAVADYNPEVIIDVIHRTQPAAETGNVWLDFPKIEAVRTGRITFVSESFLVHPSQRLVEALDAFSRIIHPEVFGKYEQ
jgi:iron complex transport system substrate-binding protein